MNASGTTGVLLAQLGTPASPSNGDVRRYLREFLSDPRVIDLPAPLRWLLVNGVIAPFRAPRSAAAYRLIWLPAGSPLRVHSEALAAGVAKELGSDFHVALGMRYGQPSLTGALEELEAAGVARIVVLPLYPQVASSSTGSSLQRVFAWAGARPVVPTLQVAPGFFDHRSFIAAVAAVARPALAEFSPDHVLLSYHSLPERHIRATDPTGAHCLESADCCELPVAANRACYRAQCFATSRALVRELELDPSRVTTSFQSRLGRTPWISPATDSVLAALPGQGVRRLAVLCPSFVADCLETVEEIGLRGRAQFVGAGGEELALVPCVNASPDWVRAVGTLVREASAEATDGRRGNGADRA